jgi:hypothetical protein
VTYQYDESAMKILASSVIASAGDGEVKGDLTDRVTWLAGEADRLSTEFRGIRWLDLACGLPVLGSTAQTVRYPRNRGKFTCRRSVSIATRLECECDSNELGGRRHGG